LDRRRIARNVMELCSKLGPLIIAVARWTLDEWRNGGGPSQGL
jgi:hypothetical protein